MAFKKIIASMLPMANNSDKTSIDTLISPSVLQVQVAAAIQAYKSYVVSATAPSNTNLIWIKTPEYVFRIHNGTAWVALGAAYAEDAGK